MLAISPLTNTTSSNDGSQGHIESFNHEDFSDFSDGQLLESIDFDDLFAGINDGDVLPDLEMDPEILAEFSDIPGKEEEDKVSGCGSGSGSGLGSGLSCLSNKSGDEIASKSNESNDVVANNNNNNNNKGYKEGDKGRKSTAQGKANTNNNNNNTSATSNQGKRKMKVDWTPELHRRFVQAVEQLGVDKAVPSRILELMGNESLTRHNIASHLQKYRSQRKHLLAREAEAASWNQKRQLYGSAAPVVAAGGGGGGTKRTTSLWHAPIMGFPPMHPHPHHHFRPLHVWGHPSLNQSMIHGWPKHLAPHSPPPPPMAAATWPPTLHPNSSYWHHQPQRVPNGLIPGTPCFPQLPAPMRFGTPHVPGVHPQAIYNVDPSGIGVPVRQPPPVPQSLLDFQPSKESIDAAIGDVLSKPWLPLPIGLKPPSTDSVLVELHRHGVSDIPPTCA